MKAFTENYIAVLTRVIYFEIQKKERKTERERVKFTYSSTLTNKPNNTMKWGKNCGGAKEMSQEK